MVAASLSSVLGDLLFGETVLRRRYIREREICSVVAHRPSPQPTVTPRWVILILDSTLEPIV
jgi:hypothetical protein